MCQNILLQILACFIPPLAVCFKKGGCCNVETFCACFLTLLGWLPGCCYACCVVSAEERGGPTVYVENKNQTVVTAPVASQPPIVINMPTQQAQPPYPYPGNGQGYGDGQGYAPGPSQPQPMPHSYPAPPAYTPTAPSK